MKNAVFWDVKPCGCCKNRRFGGTYHLRQDGKNRRATSNVVTSKKTAFFTFQVWLRSDNGSGTLYPKIYMSFRVSSPLCISSKLSLRV
jgi:hypothetical protein